MSVTTRWPQGTCCLRRSRFVDAARGPAVDVWYRSRAATDLLQVLLTLPPGAAPAASAPTASTPADCGAAPTVASTLVSTCSGCCHQCPCCHPASASGPLQPLVQIPAGVYNQGSSGCRSVGDALCTGQGLGTGRCRRSHLLVQCCSNAVSALWVVTDVGGCSNAGCAYGACGDGSFQVTVPLSLPQPRLLGRSLASVGHARIRSSAKGRQLG